MGSKSRPSVQPRMWYLYRLIGLYLSCARFCPSHFTWLNPADPQQLDEVVSVLAHLGCYDKKHHDWVAYKQQAFTSHGSAGWEVHDHGAADSVCGGDPHLSLCTITSPGGRDTLALWALWYKTLFPVIRVLPS